MKKSLLFAGAIFLTSGLAIAKTIDFDTSIKWNSSVVEQALNKSGFLGSSDANWDVRVTHERILAELLEMESFSVRDATRVCLDKCNMSDFLKNGRGASGKKCPELCSGFGNALVSVNNEFNKTGTIQLNDNGLVFQQKDGTIKIFSEDKKFYVLYHEDYNHTSIKKYQNICSPEEHGFASDNIIDAVVFKTQTNTPIALLHLIGEDCFAALAHACFTKTYTSFNKYFYVPFTSCCYEDCMPYELTIQDYIF